MRRYAIELDGVRLAVREAGSGSPLVLVHGLCADSRTFSKQFENGLAERFRLLAIDLPGHGDSADSPRPVSDYTLKGFASALTRAAAALGASEGMFFGHSMGGNVVLEAIPDLPLAAGFAISGAPPFAHPPAMESMVNPHSALAAAPKGRMSDEEARDFATLQFAPGAEVPRFALETVRCRDGTIRPGVWRDIAAGGFANEARIVREMNQPLLVVHGELDQIVRLSYLESLKMPTLWRGRVQRIPGAGHSPHWERADLVNSLLIEFGADVLNVLRAS